MGACHAGDKPKSQLQLPAQPQFQNEETYEVGDVSMDIPQLPDEEKLHKLINFPSDDVPQYLFSIIAYFAILLSVIFSVLDCSFVAHELTKTKITKNEKIIFLI
mgnify:CR=1 FL=1